jgi:hypothetical protein
MCCQPCFSRAWSVNSPPTSIAEGSKPGPEQHVLFEAVSTALACYHLVLKRRHIEPGRTPEHDIQRFVGD